MSSGKEKEVKEKKIKVEEKAEKETKEGNRKIKKSFGDKNKKKRFISTYNRDGVVSLTPAKAVTQLTAAHYHQPGTVLKRLYNTHAISPRHISREVTGGDCMEYF